jgi:DNA-binding transcriptional regulator YbjK
MPALMTTRTHQLLGSGRVLAAFFDPIAQAGGTSAALLVDIMGGSVAVQRAFEQVVARGGT